ncbi:hypothetical protein IEQ34_017269 [Dendrobium chrysotoxum]|uniref:RIN4 pathogenic type III effector avirulence factor Avr cleavage site domain-containing protein n=1 Tax=Dendrobium chrysotoxum TaxID=161865 RepID=A0AAV7FMC2_DENCH|nr:hypothetical protein IEQ34_026403 [Dendrobium chrysotoxum]KAH0452945.1 hypothetical protein IEQ34_017269 [Dendrobium chrysotoxum]
MEKSTEGTKVDWMSVPAFGDWDNQKGMPDYSLDFSKVRQMRKLNKSDYSRISIGNDEDLLSGSKKDDEILNRSKVAASAVSRSGTAVTPAIGHQHSPSGRKKVMSYFVCCIKA